MKLLTIVIPVYNVASYLRECLDSVIAAIAEMEKAGGEKRWTKEGRFLVEVICVDDGSTDGSGEMLDEYVMGKGSDPLPITCRFRVIHQKNAGVSAARNAALEVATGEWILFVDADDVVAPTWLTDYYQIIQHSEADLVVGDFARFSGSATEAAYHPVSTHRVISGVEAEEWLINRFSSKAYLVAFAFRRRVLGECRFPHGVALAEDMIFELSLVPKIKSVAVTDACGYGYRQVAQSASYQPVKGEERVRFLQAFGRLCYPSFLRNTAISKAIWAMTEYWMRRCADEDCTREIRQELSQLRQQGLFCLKLLPRARRVGAWAFLCGVSIRWSSKSVDIALKLERGIAKGKRILCGS